MNTPHETTSEEVKEEWEETFDECYSDRCDYELCCSGRDCACSGIKTADAIKDFIRTQRSLAQQEILDRVSQEARKHLSNNEDVNTLLDILSTLKDTNI